ncbi:hypothetical protein ACS0TY_032874 [Phlomoides rotata]
MSNIHGEPCDPIDLHEHTHYSQKDGWKSKETKKNWEMMVRKREEYIDLEIEKPATDIVFEVLGHGTRYVKYLGYGSKPPSRCSSLNDFSNKYKDELKDTNEEV